ncbi:hypothetical protein JCM8097_008310 [Rhodosporidiobolus ruineniae]
MPPIAPPTRSDDRSPTSAHSSARASPAPAHPRQRPSSAAAPSNSDEQAARTLAARLRRFADQEGEPRRDSESEEVGRQSGETEGERTLASPEESPAPPPSAAAPRNDPDFSRWMSSLPDSAKLDELYLPGTHESLAVHFPLLGSRCQATPLTAQLRAGVRVLDLRFSLLRTHPRSFAPLRRRRRAKKQDEGEEDGEGWDLRAYHGIVTQLKSAEEALEEVYRWLEDEGKGETVVVSVKQENSAPSLLFASHFFALLARRPNHWYMDERWPALGEVRGKCVLFCRFHFDGRGLHPPIWPNDSLAAWATEIGGREVVVQDWYGVSTLFDLPKKAALALSLLFPPPLPPALASTPSPSPTARSTAPPLPLRINFLSAASLPLAPPSRCARGFGWPRWHLGLWGVNDLFLAGLRRRRAEVARRAAEGKEGVGYAEGQGGMVVMIDFWESPSGGELVKEIVRMNFG